MNLFAKSRRVQACGLALLSVLCVGCVRAHAQASAIPSAQSGDSGNPAQGRKLLDEMVQALGGDAWLNRVDWKYEGKSATFYKSAPNPYITQFEEYYRRQPFGERVVIVSKLGVFIPTTHRDVAEVWNEQGGWEITFRGKKPLPAKDVAEFERRRAHSLDVVVKDWLHKPSTIVTYEGTDMVDRRIADKVSVLNDKNDAVTLELDESSHLPLSLTFQYRDPLYKDIDTDVEQFDDYHPVQGILTPMTITGLHNGDIVSQRFITRVTYNLQLAPDLFDPDRPLTKKPNR